MINDKLGVSLLIGVLFTVLTMHRSYSQQPVITAPASGAVVTPGQSLTISVGPASIAGQISVWASNPLPDVTQGVLANTFTLTIPTTTAPGSYNLTAKFVDNNGTVIYSSPVTIDVEPSISPASITISPPLIAFSQVGDTIPLQVIATPVGGANVDVTHSSFTTYVSESNEIATVDTNGIVSAIEQGCTQVTATYRAGSTEGVSASIPIMVPFGQQPITYDVTGALAAPIYTDGAGHYGIILKVTNNSSAPLASFSITSATLNSAPASALPPSLVLGGCANRTLAGLTFPTTAATPGTQAALQIHGAYVGALPGGVKGQPGTITIPLTVQLP
jgi:hypothetical protein